VLVCLIFIPYETNLADLGSLFYDFDHKSFTVRRLIENASIYFFENPV